MVGEDDGRHALRLELETAIDQGGGLAHARLPQDHQVRVRPDARAPDDRFVARLPVPEQHRRLAGRRRFRAPFGGGLLTFLLVTRRRGVTHLHGPLRRVAFRRDGVCNPVPSV